MRSLLSRWAMGGGTLAPCLTRWNQQYLGWRHGPGHLLNQQFQTLATMLQMSSCPLRQNIYTGYSDAFYHSTAQWYPSQHPPGLQELDLPSTALWASTHPLACSIYCTSYPSMLHKCSAENNLTCWPKISYLAGAGNTTKSAWSILGN